MHISTSIINKEQNINKNDNYNNYNNYNNNNNDNNNNDDNKDYLTSLIEINDKYIGSEL
jgi:hypothetical protein